jgi:hypothetical protein
MARPPIEFRRLANRSGGGLFVLGTGLLCLVLAWPLDGGTPARMGPGFMPSVLALMVMATGAGILMSDIRDPSADPDPRLRPLWRPLALVLAAVAVFGLLIERGGLLPAIAASVAVAAPAERGQSAREVFLLIAGLAAFCTALFVGLLGMTVDVI